VRKDPNTVWTVSDAELLGKLDNDCIVTPGWTKTLARAHADIKNLGVVACWHFFESDFDYIKAKNKIFEYKGHYILRHPWTCGTGFLIKKKTYQKYGPLTGKTTTKFWLKLAQKDLINGFYYPLIFQEHMDDPKSKHTHITDDFSFEFAKKFTVTPKNLEIKSFSDSLVVRAQILNTILCGPIDVKKYGGWKYIFNKMIMRKNKTILSK